MASEAAGRFAWELFKEELADLALRHHIDVLAIEVVGRCGNGFHLSGCVWTTATEEPVVLQPAMDVLHKAMVTYFKETSHAGRESPSPSGDMPSGPPLGEEV